METKKRPTSVAVIAWIIIVVHGLSLVITPLGYTMPVVRQALEAVGVSVAIAVLWAIVSGAIGLVSGIAILKGINWGRWLFLCFYPLSLVISWWLYGFRLTYIISIIFYIIVLVLLTAPAASTFFARGSSMESKLE